MKTSTPPLQAGLAAILVACAAPQPAAVAPTPVAAVPAPQPQAASKESLTIDFTSGRARLSPAAVAQLDGAARLYRDARPEVMIVSGHSDKIGPEYANLILSAQRAAVVKQALVDRGVPPERLQLVAVGEAEPTPATEASRAVVVTWR